MPGRTQPQAIPFTAVTFRDAFWAARQGTVAKVTVPFLYAQCETAGMIAALDGVPRATPELHDFPAGEGTRPTNPVMFWDSDVGKWVEAASYALARERNPEIERLVDALAEKIARLQAPDGYVNSYFQRIAPADRFVNLRDWHELYCAGHLIEGAIAYAAATGKRALLDCMCRYADLLCRTFGRGDGQVRGYCGHEEIELALIRLADFTGEARYRDLARFFVDERGRSPNYYDGEARARGEDPAAWVHKTYEYAQAHIPVRRQDKVVGHAVRAMYLYCAMADLAAADDDAGLRDACLRLWSDLTEKRLYVTGGLGPSFSNEGFTTDYDLPNETAYAETCAAVGLVMWAHRMTLATGEARFADVMERALYNGALAGLSLGGDRFFYDNKLASRGGVERWRWHNCPCCPANIARLVASLGGYVASVRGAELSLHLYAAANVAAGPMQLAIATDFPRSGHMAISVVTPPSRSFALRLRVPDWAGAATVSINGVRQDHVASDRGYLRIERTWVAGDRIDLDLAMPVRRLRARPEVVANLGRVALQRGPFVYCVESADAGFDVDQFEVNPLLPVRVAEAPVPFAGIAGLDVPGFRPRPVQTLYTDEAIEREAVNVRAIPYALWAHRGAGTMAVWLRTR
jgi:hypothetical protein